MSQKQHIGKILTKFGMTECKPKATLMVSGKEKIVNNESPELTDPTLYRAIVESLIYIISGTRPDLCYIVTKLSQNMARSTEAKHVLRYLKGTTEQSLKFRKGVDTLKLVGFGDSSWADDVVEFVDR